MNDSFTRAISSTKSSYYSKGLNDLNIDRTIPTHNHRNTCQREVESREDIKGRIE